MQLRPSSLNITDPAILRKKIERQLHLESQLRGPDDVNLKAVVDGL